MDKRDARSLIEEIRKRTAGDSLSVGRDPELWAAAITSAYTSYRAATTDPDATLRFTEARGEWLKVLDEFVKYDGLSAFMRYYQITDWLLETRKSGDLNQDDEADVEDRLDDLWRQLFKPERAAIEVAIEALKKQHADDS